MDRKVSFFIAILQTIGRFTYRAFFKVILIFLKIFSLIIHLIKQFRFPHFKLPSLKLPKIKLPQFKLPRLKLKISPPRFSFIKTILIFLIFIFTLSFYFFILKDLPKPTDLINRQTSLSTKIFDRHGQLLFTFYKDQNRSLTKLQNIPEHFKLATLAIEDSQFYNHKGFSWKGILRSLNQIIFKQQLQGGSTITQQLVKNALLTPERTLQRKIKELILSLEIEFLFSKDEILEMYFNEVPYGGTAYGAEQAAQTFFNKSIKDVNLAEAALLAGLPASPTTYSPFGSNPYLSIYRQHQVLNQMVESHFIAPQEASHAKQQKIKLAPQYANINAPHFVMYIKDILVKEFGHALVEQGGLNVYTSLDLDIQQTAQNIVTQEINQLFPLNITNGAALVITPQTGEILAMVGSRNYFDLERDGQVNLTTSLRQPGSAIKPVNYAVALQNGFTTSSIIQDTPVTYNIPGSKPYSPVNYDSKFHGPVTLRQALASSYNIPAVKLLASYGVDKMIDMGKTLGITTWTEPHRYGLSLTLGGAEIKMTDLAVVYSTLANQGLRVNLHPILKVTDSKNKTLMQLDCHQDKSFLSQAIAAPTQVSCLPQPALNPNIAYILTDILSDPYARAPAFGLSSFLNIPNHQVAVKTGTTNNKRDNWTIGYTSDYLVATWVGYNDNSPMSQVASGITGASPIWNKIINHLLKDQPSHQFSPPKNLIKVQICTLTGQLSCQGCPTKTEYFLPNTEPKTHCSSKQIQQILEKNKDKILTGISTENN